MISASGLLEVYAPEPWLAGLRAAGVFEAREPEDFEGSVESSYEGRGSPRLLLLPGAVPLVVKTLRHGGLLGRILGPWYFGARRLRNTLALIEELRHEGVPTPAVAFARVRRVRGLSFLCRFELATEQIVASKHLLQFLREQPPWNVRRRVAEHLGRVVGNLHRLGVDHRDLNARNVLISDQGATLHIIDWEGSVRGAAPVSEQIAVSNLERLHRSLEKNQALPTGTRGREVWAFMRAYDQAAARDWWTKVDEKRRRTRGFHRWGWVLAGRRRREARN